jgi:hypothetical protein
MNVIAIYECGEEPIVVIKVQEALDAAFAAELRKLCGWEHINDDDMLAAQTFVSWYRKLQGKSQLSIQACVDNETYAWSRILTVDEATSTA